MTERADNVVRLPTKPVESLPCPFCGCAESDINGGDSDVFRQCCGCLAEGPVATVGCRDEEELEGVDLDEEAVVLWNRRTLQELVQLELDACGSILLDVQQDAIAKGKRIAELERELAELRSQANEYGRHPFHAVSSAELEAALRTLGDYATGFDAHVRGDFMPAGAQAAYNVIAAALGIGDK